MFADSGLVREHYSVSATHNCRGDIGNLRAGRSNRRDHRVHHLRRDDNWNAAVVRSLDQPALKHWKLLKRNLKAEISARHHQTVSGVDDLIDVVKRGTALDLRDNSSGGSLLVDHLAKLVDILGASDEGDSNIVNAVSDAPLEIREILFRGCWEIDVAIGEGDSHTRANSTTLGDTTQNVIIMYRLRGQFEDSVSEKYAMTRL